MARRKKVVKKNAASSAYVRRKSQITRQPPTPRLKRRRRKNLRAPKKGFFPNPQPLTYKIVAQRSKGGPKMHFDGKHFTQRKEIASFDTPKAAASKARQLLGKYPVLRGYRLSVETHHRPR